MNGKTICISILIISFAAITACGTGQQLNIESDPSGAEVYLMRRGEYEVNASVEGFGGSFDGDSFEEEFYLLGTTPLEYEFDLSDTESSFYIPGLPAGVSVTKHYKEGILKVEMDGYETEQRTIQFSDNLFNLVLNLVPFRGDAEGDSGGRETTDEDRGRGERN
ncbi:MAG: hypothetical protein K8R76_04740 [Candidatus Aegiribacteria sp.]|nr:hypothetical protein [Candidatus Aegiribacteria sp.]